MFIDIEIESTRISSSLITKAKQEAVDLIKEMIQNDEYHKIGHLVEDLDHLSKESDVNNEIDISLIFIKLAEICKCQSLGFNQDMIAAIVKSVTDIIILFADSKYSFCEVSNYGYNVLINLTGTYDIELSLVKQLQYVHPPLALQHVWLLANIACQGVEFQKEILFTCDLVKILESLLEEQSG